LRLGAPRRVTGDCIGVVQVVFVGTFPPDRNRELLDGIRERVEPAVAEPGSRLDSGQAGRPRCPLSGPSGAGATRPEPPLTPRLWRYRKYTMPLEFDARKSAENKRKHGIDFGSAQALWDDPDLLAIPARTEEVRFIVIGRIKGKHWTGIITYRGENIRIISVRRSRPEEVAIYES